VSLNLKLTCQYNAKQMLHSVGDKGETSTSKDIELLEKVQRKGNRLMFSDKSLGYYKRLSILGLSTLETWRLWGDTQW